MAFRDAVGGYTAPRVRDRQCHRGLGQISEADAQRSKIDRLSPQIDAQRPRIGSRCNAA